MLQGLAKGEAILCQSIKSTANTTQNTGSTNSHDKTTLLSSQENNHVTHYNTFTSSSTYLEQSV